MLFIYKFRIYIDLQPFTESDDISIFYEAMPKNAVISHVIVAFKVLYYMIYLNESILLKVSKEDM